MLTHKTANCVHCKTPIPSNLQNKRVFDFKSDWLNAWGSHFGQELNTPMCMRTKSMFYWGFNRCSVNGLPGCWTNKETSIRESRLRSNGPKTQPHWRRPNMELHEFYLLHTYHSEYRRLIHTSLRIFGFVALSFHLFKRFKCALNEACKLALLFWALLTVDDRI